MFKLIVIRWNLMPLEKKFNIDFVFPYVNPGDENWRRSYNYFSSAETKYKPDTVRFRDFSLLKYIFRSIEENAPYIDRIFMLVASESQVPQYIRKNCPRLKIITHDQFIPKEYLPTFNSNTIEMFLPFIPGLSEHFIYSNDDLIFANPSEWTDFFTPAGQLRLAYSYSKNLAPTGFKYSCRATWQAVANLFPKGIKIDNANYQYIKQYHGAASPRLLSDCKLCYEALEPVIKDSLTLFRNCAENINQYMYGYYSMFAKHYQRIDNAQIGTYVSLDEKPLDEVLKIICDCRSKMLCINDTGKMTKEANSSILKELEISFPNKSIFEN